MPDQESLRDQVVKYILTQIQYLKLLPGQIINEVALAKELNVSRTPVREAMIRLVADGVLIKVPRKGYTLVEVDRRQIDNTHEIIAVLDGYAAAIALPSITCEDLWHMREIVDKIDVAIRYRNFPEYYMLQEEFHDIYVSKCGNPILIQMLKTFKGGPVRQTYFSENQDRLFQVLEEGQLQHREIVRLFEQGDAGQLERYLREVHWHTAYPDMI